MSLPLENKLLVKVARYEELLDHSAVADRSKTNNIATQHNYAKLQQERQEQLQCSPTHHICKGSHYEEEKSLYKEEQYEEKQKEKYKESSTCKSRLYTSSKSINEPAIMSRAEIHELSVQSKLDVLTQRITHAAAVQSARLSKELQHVNHKIAHEVEELGLKAYLHESGATVIQNVQTPETHAQSSARFAGNQYYNNSHNNKGELRDNAQAKSHLISHAMLNNDNQYAFRNIVPVSFHKSGFESLIQWGIVSFDEAAMTLLGPSCNVKTSPATYLTQLPHALLTSVCAFILNEVLDNNLCFTKLWSRLRTHLFNAIYSKELTGQVEQEAVNGNCDKHQNNINIVNNNNDDDDDDDNDNENNVNSFAYFTAYRPWSELYKDQVALQNELHADIDRLKETLHKRKIIMSMASNKINNYLVRSVFVQWRQHTRRVHKFHLQMTKFLSKHHYKCKVHEIFMKWRRITLTDKVNALRTEKYELMRSYEHSQRSNVDAIQALKTSLADKVHDLHLTRIKHTAELSQMQESSQLECATLQLALQQTQSLFEHYRQVSHRWERLAKTFHPFTSTGQFQSPSLGLIWAGHRLRGVEETLVLMHQSNVLVKSVVTLTKEVRESLISFLETWVNFIITWATNCTMKTTQNSKKKSRNVNNSAKSNSSSTIKSRPSSGVNNINNSNKRVNYVFDKNSGDALPSMEQTSSRAKRSYSAHSSQSSASRRALSSSLPPPPLLNSAKNAKEEDTETMVFDKRALLQLIRALRTIILTMSETRPFNEHNAPEHTNQISNMLENEFYGSSNNRKDQTNDNMHDSKGSATENMSNCNSKDKITSNNINNSNTNNNDKETLQFISKDKYCLYYELLSFLHDCTNEGLQPTLLSYCPYKHYFINDEYLSIDDSNSDVDKSGGGSSSSSNSSTLVLHPLVSVWIVSALFVGFVTKCCLFNHLDIQETYNKQSTTMNSSSSSNCNTVNNDCHTTINAEGNYHSSAKFKIHNNYNNNNNDEKDNNRLPSQLYFTSSSSWPQELRCAYEHYFALDNSSNEAMMNTGAASNRHEHPIHNWYTITTTTTTTTTNNNNNNNSAAGFTASAYDTTHEPTRITSFNNIDTIHWGIDTVDDMKVYLGVNMSNKETSANSANWSNLHRSSMTVKNGHNYHHHHHDGDLENNDFGVMDVDQLIADVTAHEEAKIQETLWHNAHQHDQTNNVSSNTLHTEKISDDDDDDDDDDDEDEKDSNFNINKKREVDVAHITHELQAQRQEETEKAIYELRTPLVDLLSPEQIYLLHHLPPPLHLINNKGDNASNNTKNCTNTKKLSKKSKKTVASLSTLDKQGNNAIESSNNDNANENNEQTHVVCVNSNHESKEDNVSSVNEGYLLDSICDNIEDNSANQGSSNKIIINTTIDNGKDDDNCRVSKFVESIIDEHEVRRQWLSLARLVVSLMTRLDVMTYFEVPSSWQQPHWDDRLTPELRTKSGRRLRGLMSGQSASENQIGSCVTLTSTPTPTPTLTKNSSSSLLQSSARHYSKQGNSLQAIHSLDKHYSNNDNNSVAHIKAKLNINNNSKKNNEKSSIKSEKISIIESNPHNAIVNRGENERCEVEPESNADINVSCSGKNNASGDDDAKYEDSVIMTSTNTSVVDVNEHLNKENHHDINYNTTCDDEHGSPLLHVVETLNRGSVDHINTSMERTLPWIESATPRTHQTDNSSLIPINEEKETPCDAKENAFCEVVHGKHHTKSKQYDQQTVYSASVNVENNAHKEQQLFASTAGVGQQPFSPLEHHQQQQKEVKVNTKLISSGNIVDNTINKDVTNNNQSTRTITGFTEPSFLAPLVLPVQRNDGGRNNNKKNNNKHSNKYHFKLHDVYHNQ